MAVSKKSLQNLEKGKKFSSGNQPENRGRRPSVIDKYIRENRVSLDDIRTLVSSLMSYNAEEIQAILKDKKDKPPVAALLILKAIMTDIDYGRLDNFVILSDRVFGKPTQSIDLNAAGNMNISMMTSDERKKRIEELLKKSEPKKTDRRRTGRTSVPS